MQLHEAKQLAAKIVQEIQPFCEKVEVCGSIRRLKREGIKDIDIIAIPKQDQKDSLIQIFHGKGGSIKLVRIEDGIKIELNLVDNPKEWGSQLMHHTGSSGYNIGLRIKAKSRGWKLSQHGLFNEKGERIAGETEEEIYEKLGKSWKSPELRS